ncbi:MAG TPA: glycosyltransferase, partial [Chloroflexota bacterium]
MDEPSRHRPCARSIEALDVPSGYTVEKVLVVGAPTTAAGYQVAMRASSAKYKVYLRPDVRLVHRGLLHELLRLFRLYPRLGMVAVRGATRLLPSGLWHDAGWRHRYGRVWEYRGPEGAVGQGGPIDRRQLRLVRHRHFVGDYLTAVAVDGMLVATQYDLEWDESSELDGLAEQAHALELIRAGYEVGIARQERVWCLRWVGRGERGTGRGGDAGRRAEDAGRQVEAFRRRYGECIGVPASELVRRYRPAAPAAGPVGERLGVVIVTFKGRDVLRRALASLIPQCEALDGLRWEIVVADNASGDGTVEMVRREFPMVAVLARESNDGPARAYNDGLRWLGVEGSVGASGDGRGLPDYVLVMNNDVEFLDGTLARMVATCESTPTWRGWWPRCSTPTARSSSSAWPPSNSCRAARASRRRSRSSPPGARCCGEPCCGTWGCTTSGSTSTTKTWSGLCGPSARGIVSSS